MRILIVENEIYLAQSIAAKLTDKGHSCDISSSCKDAQNGIKYDVVLLSTNINGQNFFPIIEQHKNGVVILMVSYMSSETVTKPLEAGASDYIQKPFSIDLLLRKIDHYQEHERIKKHNNTLNSFMDYSLNNITLTHELNRREKPVFIVSSNQKYADAYAFKYATKHNRSIHFISLSNPNALSKLNTLPNNEIIYLCDFNTIKKIDRKIVYNAIRDKEAIISTNEVMELSEFESIEIKSEAHIFDRNDILPIEDYVKYIILNYQQKFPDTELSKKLGISRKSLWEKRKKYGISKQK
ncbi:MAG: response regulator [Campylobacterota bacterium]|nr:response regulator [Campylobacterota bacterium]